MSFNMREFVKRGLIDAIGNAGDYWVILNAAAWLEKGVLTEDDLAEIETLIEARHPVEATEENNESEGE